MATSALRRRIAAACSACILFSGGAAAQGGVRGEPRFVLTPLVTIGGDDAGEAYTFNRVSDVVSGADGTLYVLDAGDQAVKAYDDAGRFLRRFGRRGAGPGEFTVAVGLRVDSVVTVFDATQSRYSVFSLAGEHRRTRRLPAPGGVALATRYPLRDGFAVGMTAARHSLGSPANDPFHTVLLIAPDGGLADTLLVYHSGGTVWHPVNAVLPWGIAASDFGPAGAWAVLGDSVVAVVDGYGGTVRWLAIAGGRARQLRAARLPIPSRAITREDLAAVERRLREESRRRVALEPPPRWSAATRALFADDGALWIQNGNGAEESRIWTVFDREGRYLRRLQLPAGFALRSIRGDRLYGVAKTDLDVDVVRVFRLEEQR
jgi:6-bladed beta-propeller